MKVRPPAVSGVFYPARPGELEAALSSYLAEVPREAGAGAPAPKALIVPHAGYVYSGPVAASAYARISGLRGRIRRVVLLGPSHRVALRGLAAPASDAFETPLGVVPIDRAGIACLSDLPQVAVRDDAHAQEHSLEVQLPFLQHALGDFSLLPLVVGDADDGEVAEVIERLWGGPETLFVISSDLSHYQDYATAQHLDAVTRDAIEALDPAALDWESACGRIPVRGLLCAARRRGLRAETLDLRSSGDTAGDRSRVVGYGAWAFAAVPSAAEAGADDGEPNPSSDDVLLLDLARASVTRGSETGRPPRVELARYPDALREPGACFVTLRSRDGELRGCIGSLEPQRPLAEDVARNAFAAAYRDPRMEPVSKAEIPGLHIGISVLGPAEEFLARSLADVAAQLRPGRDGLILEDRDRRGTLLPQVWRQLADPRAFAGAVWQKAGLPADHWSGEARAWRYEVREIAEP